MKTDAPQAQPKGPDARPDIAMRSGERGGRRPDNVPGVPPKDEPASNNIPDNNVRPGQGMAGRVSNYCRGRDLNAGNPTALLGC